MQYFWLVFLWMLYFVHHSTFATNRVKSKLYEAGFSYKIQRIVYSTFSLVGLFGLLLYNGLLGGERLLSDGRLVKGFGLFLATGGVFIIRSAFRAYSLRSFLGMKESERELRTDGILKFIRHPLYTATILIFLGFFAYDSRLASLISVLCVLIYLPIGIWLEEKKLFAEYGKKYEKYASQVPMLFPNFKGR